MDSCHTKVSLKVIKGLPSPHITKLTINMGSPRITVIKAQVITTLVAAQQKLCQILQIIATPISYPTQQTIIEGMVLIFGKMLVITLARQFQARFPEKSYQRASSWGRIAVLTFIMPHNSIQGTN